MNIHDPHISLETAKLLKEAGFNEATQFGYRLSDGQIVFEGMSLLCHNNLEEYASAPTLHITQRWLREVKRCEVYVIVCGRLFDDYYTVMYIESQNKVDVTDHYQSYDKAFEAGIAKCLKLLLGKE